MNNESETTRKGTRVWIRIIAFVLAALFILQLALAGISRVEYSADEYAGTALEGMALYIMQNDEYMSSGYINRMRNTVRSLGTPEDFSEYYLFASVAIADNEYSKAIDYLDTCIGMYSGSDEGLAVLHLKQGCLYSFLGDWEKASSAFQKGAELEPESADARSYLATACYNNQDYKGALDALTDCSSLRELEYEEVSEMALSQYQLADYESAVETFTLALTFEEADEASLLNNRALAYYQLGRYDEARADGERLIELGDDYEESMNFIAGCYEGEGDYQGVLNILLEMADNGVDNQKLYNNILSCAMAVDDYAAQETAIIKLLAYNPDEETRYTLLVSLASAQLQQKEFEACKANLELCLQQQPENMQLLYLHGVCLLNLEEYDEAFDEFSTVLTSGILIDECHYNKAICYVATNYVKRGMDELNLILERNEDPEMVEKAEAFLASLGG